MVFPTMAFVFKSEGDITRGRDMPKVTASQWVNSWFLFAGSRVCSFAGHVAGCWVIGHQLIRR